MYISTTAYFDNQIIKQNEHVHWNCWHWERVIFLIETEFSCKQTDKKGKKNEKNTNKILKNKKIQKNFNDWKWIGLTNGIFVGFSIGNFAHILIGFGLDLIRFDSSIGIHDYFPSVDHILGEMKKMCESNNWEI